MTCRINTEHCEECGRPCAGDQFNQGYSPCCNELITYSDDCRAFHAERGRNS